MGVQMRSSLTQLLRYAAAYANDAAARRFGDRVPYVYVAEFPRSGANWIRDLAGDVLQLPVPRFGMFPVTFRAILQTHSAVPIRGPKIIYLVRDGRDVFVSHYYKTVNSFLAGGPSTASRVRRIHPSVVGASANGLRNDSRFEAFYREWRVRSLGSRVGWGRHVETWTDQATPETLIVRYEDMRSAPKETLARIVRHLSNAEPAEYLLDFAIRRNAFEEKTGRKPGVVDDASNRRSGAIGGWRGVLSEPLLQAFQDDFGPVLAKFGYNS